MTDNSKRLSFSQMCAALPEDFSWGDSLTPDVFQHIEDAILQAATRDEPDFDAAEATVILEDDQILAIEKMVADQIFKEGTQSRKNLTLRTVRTCINVASKPVATRDEPSALTTEVLETLDMFMSLYRAKGWEGDAAYERAEALIAARTPKESK